MRESTVNYVNIFQGYFLKKLFDNSSVLVNYMPMQGASPFLISIFFFFVFCFLFLINCIQLERGKTAKQQYFGLNFM